MGAWKSELISAARDAKISFQWVDDIKNEAHARATIGVLKAFGDSAGGFVYTEPCVRERTKKPPDILLAHPSTGIVVLEIKGWAIDDIQEIKGGHIIVREKGFNRPHNVFDQASGSMYQIKDSTRRIIRQELGADDDEHMPAFDFFVMFPRISIAEWIKRSFENSKQYLFFDHLEKPKFLRECIEQYIGSKKRKSLITAEQLRFVQKAFGDSAVINDTREVRIDVEDGLRGSEIDEFIALEKNLSSEQQELSRANFEGRPQLIRGVAGSGKSVVLANNAARFINRRLKEAQENADSARNPRVAIICFNRALVSFLREKTKSSFEQQTLEKPPSGTIDVNYLNGLLFSMSDSPSNSKRGPLNYQRYGEDNKDPNIDATIATNYRQQLEYLAQTSPDLYDSLLYDAIYVDEGQDFHVEQLQLLMMLIRPNSETGEKNIVIFYDDAQNLYARPRPNWAQIGIDIVGGRRSRVMKECFRNSKEIVTFAFNVLLGTKAPSEVRVQTREYADVAYLKTNGLVEELDDRWKVNFAERPYMAPEVHLRENRHLEKTWIADQIYWLVDKEGVRPEDILVMFKHSREFSDLDDYIGNKSGKIQGFVKPFGKNENDKDAYIFRKNYLTISTTYGAKGYDAPVVFLVGADQFENSREGRASFYVGATRAKMLLFVTGVNAAGSLIQEAQQVQQLLFTPNYKL